MGPGLRPQGSENQHLQRLSRIPWNYYSLGAAFATVSARPPWRGEETAMPISLYDISIPVLCRGLSNLSAILDKAAAHAAARKYDSGVLAHLRLFPDMHPLTRQVQIACDTAKGAAARLAATEIPRHEDTETTLDELKQRIAKTTNFLKTVRADQVNGGETRIIEIKVANGAWKFTALAYLTDFVLPNFYFHVAMVYALLRESGIEIGKTDFLGTIQ
jgi:hypothetical protein